MKPKVIFYKALTIQKSRPDLTLKEAYRIASIKHCYKMKRGNGNEKSI